MNTELLEKYLNRDSPYGELLTETQLRHLRSFAEWLDREAAQQGVQADLANGYENEVDPIAQALRNLGSAIAPPTSDANRWAARREGE